MVVSVSVTAVDSVVVSVMIDSVVVITGSSSVFLQAVRHTAINIKQHKNIFFTIHPIFYLYDKLYGNIFTNMMNKYIKIGKNIIIKEELYEYII